MPTYQYRCKDCEAIFEFIKKMSEPKPNCIQCESGNTTRVFTNINFILKGGGWAKDLYEKPNNKE